MTYTFDELVESFELREESCACQLWVRFWKAGGIGGVVVILCCQGASGATTSVPRQKACF